MSSYKSTRCVGVLILYLCCMFSATECISRTVQTEIWDPPENSTCASVAKTTNFNVVTTTAVGHNDTLHYIMTSYGIPSLLMIRTDKNAKVHIDPDKFCNESLMRESVSVSGSGMMHAYALIFPRLLEYNDFGDKAVLPDDDAKEPVWHNHLLNGLAWVDVRNTSDLEKNHIVFRSDTSNQTGSLAIEFRIFKHADRSSYEPHLRFSQNSFEFDIALEGLQVKFPASRFALEMVTFSNFSSQKSDNPAELNILHSIDDEHSPGVFQIVDWTSGRHGNPDGMFMQWKPVCYTDSTRSFQGITKAKNYTLNAYNPKTYAWTDSLAYAFFGETELMTISGTNVSFGLAKDKFYVNSNYSVWTAAVGYGSPFKEQMSLLIIIVISVGLGLPVLLIIFGGIGVCIKKHKERNASPYRSIN